MTLGWDASLPAALQARSEIIRASDSALRLYNGFYEGFPELVVDLFERTLVIHDYTRDIEMVKHSTFVGDIQSFVLERLPWVECGVHKARSANDPTLRKGSITFGDNPANEISEHGVRYALDLFLSQDTSFYLDTRNLRYWLLNNTGGQRVLNMFAYTGSLGVAALAGGAAHVVQVDRQKKFLAFARNSAMLNRLDLGKMKLHAVDFFTQVAYYKRNAEIFDCVIVDPPFFSSTAKGTIDLVNESMRVVNKLRPLVCDGGHLVVVNNALFLSGAEYLRALERLCESGYLVIEEIIPVPMDVTGYPQTVITPPPCDPAPFNHPTKVVVLKVRVK